MPSNPHSLSILKVSLSDPFRRTIDNLTAFLRGGTACLASPAAEAVAAFSDAAAAAAADTDKKSRRDKAFADIVSARELRRRIELGQRKSCQGGRLAFGIARV